MAEVHAESFLGGSKERTTIEYTNINLVLSQKKQKTAKVILDNVSGVIQSSRLTALMGPSGSGKTS
jgi:ABC-type multidrug transport system ATPase subunit